MRIILNTLCGLAGGLVGLAAMGKAMQKIGRGDTPPKPPRSISKVGEHHAPGEPATEALARTVYEKATGRIPSDETKKKLGQGVHYGYGLLMASAYGLARARHRGHGLDLLGGLAFALGLWALGDLLAVPMLGLADSPTVTPAREHAMYLGGHLAYGLATATTAQAIAHIV